MNQPYERPAWAFTEEVTAGGQTVFRDAHGQRLTAIAFTEPELNLLRRALAGLAQDQQVIALQSKLISEDDIEKSRPDARHT